MAAEKPAGIITLSGKDFPTWPFVLDKAHQMGLVSIETELLQIPTEANQNVAIVRARATFRPAAEGEPLRIFCAHGDANPGNVNRMVAGALIRMAETRAAGRALRNGTNIGETMYEELGEVDAPHSSDGKTRAHAAVTAAETHAVSDRVTRPTPPAPKPPSDPSPGFEAWFEVGANRHQRVSLISTCLADQFKAQEQGLPVEALDTEKATNEQLFAYGRTLRQRLKAAKDAREIAPAAGVVP